MRRSKRADGPVDARLSVVSHCNEAASRLGVKAGQRGEEAAGLIIKGPAGRPCDLTGVIDETVHEMLAAPRGKVYAVWSFSRVDREHPNDVFCVASRVGKVMAQYALPVKPRGLIAKDAGGYLDDSRIGGLALVDELFGIPAATVSADSARIGDPLSTYKDGVISGVNDTAKSLGVDVGIRASEAARVVRDRP